MGISRGFSSHRPSNFSRNSLPSGSKLPEEDYLDALRAYADTMYGRMLDTAEGKQFFLDKTPAYALVLPFLTKLYPNAKYVVLTRHPLAILTSYVNSFFDGEWEVAQSHNPILERYVPALAKMVRDKPVPLAHLRYEEFVANPEAGFRTICDYLGVEFEASAIDYQESGKSFEGLGDPTGVHQHDRPVTSSVGSWAGEIAAAAWALDEHPCTYDGWDVDGDGICGIPDNCPNTPNASQADSDADGVGDACDNCIGAPNPGQEDMDNDGEGDACDTDIDGDGCENGVDEDALDPTQVVGWWTSATCTPSSGLVTDWAGTDSDGDGIRDCQEPDNDADGVPDAQDVCPTIYGTNPAMCMQYEDCPLISIFSMCEIVPCLDILVMIDSLINPDPTTIFERVDVIAEGVLRLQVAQGENPREIARLMARGFGVQLDREDAAAIEVHFDRARLVGDLVGDAIHVNVVDGVAEVSMGE